MYWVEVKGDGQVRYDGIQYVKIEGLQAALIPPAACARILQKAQDIRLFDMTYKCKFVVFDVSHVVIDATDGNRSVHLDSVWDGRMDDADARMHIELGELANLIDDVVGTGRWVTGS